MHDDRELVEARIRRQLRERVIPAVDGAAIALDVLAHHVPGEPISVEAARTADFEPFVVGSAWGAPWSTTWFRLRATVPAEWAGSTVEAVVDLGGGGGPGFTAEALVWGDDGPQEGIHPDKKTVLIGAPVAGGESVDLLVEAAANPDFSRSHAPNPLGDRATAGGAPLYRLDRAQLRVRNDEVWHLVLDIKTLTRLMVELPTNEPRRNLILRALERAFDALDLDDIVGTAAAGRAELVPELSKPANASAHTISAAGHAHIDTAWLWPLRETRRKCARTFANQVMLMDRHPEHVFVCSQAQQYAWMKDDYPELFARIAEKVAAGQFVPVGSMWVEADANIPSGESLVRQFVHGKRFFAEEFGVDTTEVWIPDVFGYSGQLPQIMALAGCRWFLTQKLSWNDTNRFPHHTFWWEGIDGTRIFTHFPPAETYNGIMRANELLRAVHGYAEHGRGNRSFYPFGHGDGGGGPTAEMLELARRQADLEGLPRVDLEAPEAFFTKAHDEYPDAAVWRGELYFEMHRGTYTSQAKTKWGNRRGEMLLREAELWSTVASRGADDFDHPSAELDRWWKVLLLHQFHDIIPGSSIAWVHQDTEADHALLHTAVEALIEQALQVIGQPTGSEPSIVLANAAGHARREVVTVEPALAPRGGAASTQTQTRADGRVSFIAECAPTAVSEWVGIEPRRPTVARVDDEGFVLDNGVLDVRVAADGTLASIVDVASRREALAGPGNVLQLHDDHPNQYDAWDIDAVYRRSVDDLCDIEDIGVTETGPLVASVRVRRSFGSSAITQTYSLAAESSFVEVATEVDWQESEKLLKAAFPLAIRASEASYEIQFGHVQRPTHQNTSWDSAQFEVCGHKWADVSEPGFGVALFNDSKYGHDCADNVLRLTLLKSASYPDPDADRGMHHFRYAVRPHLGSLQEAGIVEEALAFNLPIRALAAHPAAGRPNATRPSGGLVTIGTPGVTLESVKLADDGSGEVVLRLYESHGRHVTTSISVAGCATAVATDLLERGDEAIDIDAVEFGPFQIRTLRFR